MSSTDNPPSLALSDIMHPMSPSPAPTDDEKVSNYAPTGRIAQGAIDLSPQESYDAYPSLQLSNIQSRLQAMGYLAAKEGSDMEERALEYVIPPNTSAREQELVEMIKQLTRPFPADINQLEQQAETISNLRMQRNMALDELNEERERWKAERDGWDRTAEALLVRGLRFDKGTKSDDFEQPRGGLVAENRHLRDKLGDLQQRFSVLEDELTRLKPLLLMQGSNGFMSLGGSQTFKLPERNRTASSNLDGAPYPPSHPATPSVRSISQPAKRKARTSKRLSASTATSRPSHSLPLTSDARLDHVLLAARKFGRQRANSLAGVVTQPVAPTSSQGQALNHRYAQAQPSGRGSKTKELHFKETPYSRLRKEQEKKDMEVNGSSHHRATGEFLLDSGQRSTVSTATHRTPKRNGASPYSVKTPVPAATTPTPTYATNTPSHLSSLMSSPIATAGSSPLTGKSTASVPDHFQFAPSQVYSFVVSPTPSSSAKGKQKAPANGSPAPTDPSSASGGGGRRALNSLFEAAKSMEIPEGSDPSPSTVGPKANGKRKVAEPSLSAPSSGVQNSTTKRRKVISASRGSVDTTPVEDVGKGNVQPRAGGGKGRGKGVEKVMSALDVLADQAAAATASSSSIPNEESSERLVSNGKGNGGRAAADPERMSEETMTTRRTRRNIVSPESGNRKSVRGSDSGTHVGEARIIALAPEVEADPPRLASSIDQGLEIEPAISLSPQPKDLGDRNSSTRFQDVAPSALPRVTEPAVAHCADQPPVNLDAEDGDEDDDAEGDDDEEEEMQRHDAKPPSRSRTPPPDPDGGAGFNPTSGTGGNDDLPGAGDEDGHEADADADGDIDANDNAPSGSVRRRKNLEDDPASRRFAHYRLTPLQAGDHYYVQNTAGHLFDSSTSSTQERCRNDHDCGSRGCDSHVRGFGSATKALRMDTRFPNFTLARDGSAGTHSFISLGGINTRVAKFHDGLPSPSTRSFGTTLNNSNEFERSRMNVFFLIPQVGCGVASEENTLLKQKRLLRDQIWELESVKGTFRTCTYRSPSTPQLMSSSTPYILTSIS